MSNLATIVNNILADSGIDDINVVVTNGSYSNPAWITALSWSKITSTPTTLSGYGITDAVPANRTITINGTAQDLSANRSWSVGTVTSVDMTVPTGFAISGRPITSSGTLALTFAAGYSLPTTAVQSNWTTAYNDSIVSAAVSGTTTKTLTLTQQDGGTITASWTDYDTAPVTSVNAGTGISVNQTTGAVTVTNTGVLVNDITSSSGQGRFGGWYQGNGYTGAAVEVGYTGGNGYVITYNRATSTYLPLIFNGSHIYLNPVGGGVYINTSPLIRQSAGVGWLSGNYASSETASTTGAIYSIGGSYFPTGSVLNTMYGIGYTHSAQGQMPSGASSWGFYVAANGVARVWLGGDDGNIIAQGNIYMGISNLVATQSWVNSQGFITGGPYLPIAGGTLTGALTITTSNDGALTLRVPSGDSNQWNYINFTGSDGVRDAYFGTDGSGNPQWWRDDNSLRITLGSVATINDVQIVTNSGTWGISITGNADTVDGYHATNAANGLAYYASNGYLYAPSWINVDNGGIYSNTNSAHLRPNPGSYGPWLVTGSRNSYRGLEFESGVNGNVALMIHNNSNTTGFYNPSYGWQFYWENGVFYVYKNAYGGGTQATVLDSSNYTNWAAYKFGNTANGFSVNELSYATTQFNPSAGARTTLSPMSIKMWDNYFAGIGLGSDYGTVLEYYSRGGHVDSQVYFDAAGGSWYRTAAYAAGFGSWQKYVTENGGTWSINITGTAASETLSTVTNRGNSTGTSIYIDTAGEGFVFRTGGASWGGWARNTHVISTSANTVLAAFGGYGGDGNSLSYSYIGLDYITNWIRFSSSAVNSQVALQQGGNQVLHAGNYSSYALPLTGGTITGVVTINGGGTQPLTLTTSSNGPWALNLFRSDLSSSSRVFNNGGFWYFEHRPQFNGNLALDAANYSSYALPLSGGTMTGAITTPAGTSIYMGGQNVSTSSRIVINWHSDGDYNYLIGKRAGTWTQPMDIAFYTGLRYHAHSAYNAHIFYVGGYDSNEAFSIGRGDSNVRVTNTLYSYAYRGNGNVDGTGEASFHPAGIYSTGNNWLYGTLHLAGSNIRSAGGIGQGNTLSRPNTQWGATSATGPVVIKFPGNSSNYGMVHAVIDIYEYNGNNVSTVIVGGHNWASYWVNYGANVIGYTDKPVRVAFKDGQYCIVIGNSGSSWSYGQVVLRKIQNGTYYSGSMELVSGISIGIESDSYSWVSGDLRQLRVPGNIYMNETLVATQSWVNSQGFATGGPFVPARGVGNWNDNTVINNVVGMLAWKNYNNNHIIFDASASTAPNGVAISNTDSQNAWTGTYPTLMGWNGSQTYGVRVDRARLADTASNANTLGGYALGNTTNTVAYWSSTRNLWVNNPESYSGEVRLGAAWDRGGVYASSTLSLSTSGTEIHFVFSNATKAYFNSIGNLYIGQGTAYSSIFMGDSDEGQRELHCNSNRIGFLNSSGSWGSWCEDNGSWYSAVGVWAPAFYDSDNDGYYANFANSSFSAVFSGTIRLDSGAFGTNSRSGSSQAAISRTFAPQGASFGWNNGGVTAAIKIRLPIRGNDCMWSMKVRIYNYANDSVSEYTIGNYSYAAGAYHRAAYFIGGTNATPQTVRFGNDGSYDCVWIGETSTYWSYPQVSVMDFQGGYVRCSVSETANNWDISFVTSFNTVADSVTPSIRFSNVYAPIYYDIDNTNYYLDPASTSVLNQINFGTAYISGQLRNNGDVSDDDTFGLYWSSSGSTAYAIYRESGAWNWPYPDLRIAFHTGIKFGANASYKGMNFYTDYDMSGLVLSVNNADYNTGGIYVHGSAYASAYYETSDARVKTILEDNSRVKGIELIKPKLYEKDGKMEFGYIAQDFLDIMPYAINNDNVDELYSLVYREVHTAKIAYLEDSIEEIKAKILYLENQLKTKQ